MHKKEYLRKATKLQKYLMVCMLILFSVCCYAFSVPFGVSFFMIGLIGWICWIQHYTPKDYAVFLTSDFIEGFDIVNLKRVTIPLSGILRFGILKKQLKPSSKMHFNFHNRFFAQYDGGRIEVVLNNDELTELVEDMKKIKSAS